MPQHAFEVYIEELRTYGNFYPTPFEYLPNVVGFNEHDIISYNDRFYIRYIGDWRQLDELSFQMTTDAVITVNIKFIIPATYRTHYANVTLEGHQQPWSWSIGHGVEFTPPAYIGNSWLTGTWDWEPEPQEENINEKWDALIAGDSE